MTAIHHSSPRLVFLAAPANPTGEFLSREALEEIATACARSDTLLVLDQAYDAFMETPLGTPALPGHTHVVHLRSLTKEHAIAGVRAAFAVAPPDVIRDIERARVPWASSSAAQAAAVAAMTDSAIAHVIRTTAALRAEARRIVAECSVRGLETSISSTHFVIVRCGRGGAVRERLLADHGILVRDCASFGLPEWIRVAARTPADNDLLVAALDGVRDVARSSALSCRSVPTVS